MGQRLFSITYKRLKSIVGIFVIHVSELIHFIAHFDHEVRSRVVVVGGKGFLDAREDGEAFFRVAA